MSQIEDLRSKVADHENRLSRIERLANLSGQNPAEDFLAEEPSPQSTLTQTVPPPPPLDPPATPTPEPEQDSAPEQPMGAPELVAGLPQPTVEESVSEVKEEVTGEAN